MHAYSDKETQDNYDYDYYHEDGEEEDDLGYYPDGVKRTLTDEQIRIFRHSEIHALRREKELAEEARAERSREQPSENAGTEQADKNSSQPGSRSKNIQSGTAGSEAISLDYDEEGQTKRGSQRFSRRPFAGRKIISYEDWIRSVWSYLFAQVDASSIAVSASVIGKVLIFLSCCCFWMMRYLYHP